MSKQVPSIGRMVHYVLSEDDAGRINRRRTTHDSITARLTDGGDANARWPEGAQGHIGNAVSAGEEYPMIVVRVSTGEAVNGQVFLDGNDVFWATSAPHAEGTVKGSWHWPEYVAPSGTTTTGTTVPSGTTAASATVPSGTTAVGSTVVAGTVVPGGTV